LYEKSKTRRSLTGFDQTSDRTGQDSVLAGPVFFGIV